MTVSGCHIICFLTLAVFQFSCIYGLKPETIRRHEQLCLRFGKDPYFDSEMVVGKPWRIYYTWNMKLENTCLDMVFKNATPRIVQRIWNDMSDYLEQQPAWNAATLHATLGRARHEILMFADQGPAGSFVAVPNVIRDGSEWFDGVHEVKMTRKQTLNTAKQAKVMVNTAKQAKVTDSLLRFDSLHKLMIELFTTDISPIRSAVPLLKFQLKLLREGKFLVMMDCQVGVSSLSARADRPPYRSEILAATANLDLGDGFPACVSDRNKDERFLVK